jgi:hypothetical protein
MKIAVIIPPASINLGNDFFALGGLHAAKQVFPDADFRLIEFYDSGENSNGPGRTCFFIPATLEWIKNEADMIILFAGCALHTNLAHLYEPLLNTGVPFVGWGLSPTQYNESDIQFAKLIADNSKLLITRDDRICKLVGDYPNLMSGLDGGWWFGDSFGYPDKSSHYNIVNLEKSAVLDVRACLEYLKKLDPSQTTFITSNNCESGMHWSDPRSLTITNAKQLWSLYANAGFVTTTRAHTTICCLTSGVPVDYLGIRDNRVEGMLESVGIYINNGDMKNVNECKEKIVIAKANFLREVKERLA